MPSMNNVIRKHNSKIMKDPAPLTSKLAVVIEKQTVLWMVTVFLSALFTKHLLIQLLINITMVLVKILSKNVTITINVLLEINLLKRTLNCLCIYGNWKMKILFYQLGYCYEITEIYFWIMKVWFMYLWEAPYCKSSSCFLQ